MTLEEAMEAYFDAYRERYPRRSAEDAVKATRRYVEGLLRMVLGEQAVDAEMRARIEGKLSRLRLGKPYRTIEDFTQ